MLMKPKIHNLKIKLEDSKAINQGINKIREIKIEDILQSINNFKAKIIKMKRNQIIYKIEMEFRKFQEEIINNRNLIKMAEGETGIIRISIKEPMMMQLTMDKDKITHKTMNKKNKEIMI